MATLRRKHTLLIGTMFVIMAHYGSAEMSRSSPGSTIDSSTSGSSHNADTTEMPSIRHTADKDGRRTVPSGTHQDFLSSVNYIVTVIAVVVFGIAVAISVSVTIICVKKAARGDGLHVLRQQEEPANQVVIREELASRVEICEEPADQQLALSHIRSSRVSNTYQEIQDGPEHIPLVRLTRR